MPQQKWSGRFDDYPLLYQHAQIVGATVYTNISQFPRNFVFDVCIVDEAGQITEPAILQTLSLARRVLLVGDSKQLPPLVQSTIGAQGGLDVSLMSRLESREDSDRFSAQLNIQYRMNEEIMNLSNFLIYDNCLQVGDRKVDYFWSDNLGGFCDLASDRFIGVTSVASSRASSRTFRRVRQHRLQ